MCDLRLCSENPSTTQATVNTLQTKLEEFFLVCDEIYHLLVCWHISSKQIEARLYAQSYMRFAGLQQAANNHEVSSFCSIGSYAKQYQDTLDRSRRTGLLL